MGCLTITVQKAFQSGSYTATPVEGLGSLEVEAQNSNTPISIHKKSCNKPLIIYYHKIGDGLDIKTKNKNIKLSISAALVCTVGTGEYEFLYVTDGPLMVVDGYLMVKKQLI